MVDRIRILRPILDTLHVLCTLQMLCTLNISIRVGKCNDDSAAMLDFLFRLYKFAVEAVILGTT